MNLNDLLTQLSSMPGVVFYKHYRDLFDGTIKQYLFLQTRDGVIRRLIVEIFVKDFGQPTEEAEACDPTQLDISTPFKDAIMAALPAYLTAHPEIEKYVFESVDETNEIAIVIVYEYDSAKDRTERKRKIVYKKNGSLTVRTYLGAREIINEYLKTQLGL